MRKLANHVGLHTTGLMGFHFSDAATENVLIARDMTADVTRTLDLEAKVTIIELEADIVAMPVHTP